MWTPWLAFLPLVVSAMRVDPERIAARLRIEAGAVDDHLERSGRGRRQLQPKEISIQVTAPLFSSRLFEFGKDAEDNEVPQALDVGKKVQLTNPLKFYGEDYNTLYVLSNGAIGFEANARTYKAGLFPSGAKMIAPFWNRNDLRKGGHVYYREVTKGRVLERGQSEIRYQYDQSVHVKSAVVVTWEKMQPLEGTTALPEENTNTFQAALFITDNGTFANFIYSNIGWTQGAEVVAGASASAINPAVVDLPSRVCCVHMLIKAAVAEAGFNRGDNTEHYALPTSGTGNIMYLEEYGNTGIPGEWMFELGQKRVVRCKQGIKGDTCDEECASGEWGADCALCCHCSEGTCHALTGECPKGCAECWLGGNCQTKKENCHARASAQCALNAISFTDYDRCGEPLQRCQCLSGFTGDGYKACHDIDECREQVCHRNAVCTNTPGRFFCQCQEGFSGDGVSECVASFLFPSDSHQPLPKSKTSKVLWQLKMPMKLFGNTYDKITVTTSGLLSLSDVPKPFGDNSDTLTRVTRSVQENYEEPTFQARSVLIVTFMNVTDGKASKGNTFQTLLINGRNANREEMTFAEMLYKDMQWGDGAEAGIMTNDVSSSVTLPGSGTQGVEQLSQLSNVGQPGVWMFRIDEPTIQACPLADQQPPYCQKRSRPTERVIPARPSQASRPTTPAARIGAPSPAGIPVEPPRIIQPQIVSAHSVRQNSATNAPIEHDFEELGPDVFEITFPPFVTVVPEVFTSQERPKPNFTVEESSTTRVTEPSISTTQPTFPTFMMSDSHDTLVTTTESAETTEQITTTIATTKQTTTQSTTVAQIFVFTTTPKPTVRTTPKRPQIVTAGTTTTVEPEEDREAAASKMAIIIPSVIVVIWILLLIAIALFVCCRRRSSSAQLRPYGPVYSVQPTAYALKRNVAEGSYEEQLEKAARLSGEMSAYNQLSLPILRVRKLVKIAGNPNSDEFPRYRTGLASVNVGNSSEVELRR
ncbi:unnamed protein product [Nippostrongylus brasiliensis]|uniref:Nidogen n=1 Tax=Nippostrongylus brasiliensis TaxID=27835 RepID=A0A158QXW4_NIPBR|nr:unnamed protein product [Nippostrongylus brasiliensis]